MALDKYHSDLIRHVEARIVDEMTIWTTEHSAAFVPRRILADIGDDDRALAINLFDPENRRLFVSVVFDEVRFDYEGFERLAWSNELERRLGIGQARN